MSSRNVRITRVDASRRDQAEALVDYCLTRVSDDGRWRPTSGLFGESLGYHGQMMATLGAAGRLLERADATAGARRMAERLLADRIGDVWPVGWWDDFPCGSTLDDTTIEQYRTQPNARYTALCIYNLGIYHRATGDPDVVESGLAGLHAAFHHWDFTHPADFIHLTCEFIAGAAWAWSHVDNSFMPRVRPLVDWCVATTVEQAPHDFPYFTVARSVLLLALGGTQHLKAVVRPAIEHVLAAKKWRHPASKKDLLHFPDPQDIANLNCRANTAMAYIMRLADNAAQDDHFTRTTTYAHLAQWTDGMRDDTDGSYFEVRDPHTSDRKWKGSPGQYIPLWWMLGGPHVEPQ